VSLLPEGDSGDGVAPALGALPLPLPPWPLPELAAGALMEGKDGGG